MTATKIPIFFCVLDECRQLLEDMGQTVHDERYKDNIFRAPLAEYEKV